MATTKKTAASKTKPAETTPVAASAAPTTAALMHGPRAAGAARVKPGFAFTEEMDLAFALGWPNLWYVVDGHPDDRDPAARGLELMMDTVAAFQPVWPRESAIRYLRIWALPERFGTLPGGGFGRLPAVNEAPKKPGPLTAEEARDIVHHGFAIKSFDTTFARVLLILEAIVGPSVVVGHALDALEALPAEVFTEAEQSRHEAILRLGFTLLRVPADEAEAARARLEKLFGRTVARLPGGKIKKATTDEQYPPYRALDLILHGRAGAERSGDGAADGECARQTMLWVDDDPQWVVETLRKTPNPMDTDAHPNARLVFLGGEEILEIERKIWKKYEVTLPEDHLTLVRTYGEIRSERVVQLMLEMSVASKAKKQASDWLRAHADFARPHVERAAKKSGALGDAAKAALKKL